MRVRSTILLLAAVLAVVVLPAASVRGATVLQQAVPPPSPPPPPGRPQGTPPPATEILRVFLDCPDGDCDYDFLRQEITFVNIVRDRKDADVHVLVTSQLTGGGGWDCTINMIGQKAFEKMDHVIHYVTKATDTSDENRKGIARMLKLGLVQYVTAMPVAGELDVVHKRPTTPQGASRGAHDPWDSWLFRTSLRSSSSGESSRTSLSLSGSFSANRITEAWKITNSASVYYSSSRYTFSEGDSYTALSRESGVNSMAVKSIGKHWAAGATESLTSSTYLNQRLALRVAPAVEYDVYPYSQSTRRQLTFNYGVGISHVRYLEETIFGKTAETLADHRLVTSFDMKEKWGTLNTSFQASQYLHDLSKNDLALYTGADVRLFKGFSLSVSASVSRIRDQLYLPKGEATQEEVLVRQRQLATSYQYYYSIGFTYSFGSIFNNVVNPRFSGSSGGMVYYY
jgi:hypothetical protein